MIAVAEAQIHQALTLTEVIILCKKVGAEHIDGLASALVEEVRPHVSNFLRHEVPSSQESQASLGCDMPGHDVDPLDVVLVGPSHPVRVDVHDAIIAQLHEPWDAALPVFVDDELIEPAFPEPRISGGHQTVGVLLPLPVVRIEKDRPLGLDEVGRLCPPRGLGRQEFGPVNGVTFAVHHPRRLAVLPIEHDPRFRPIDVPDGDAETGGLGPFHGRVAVQPADHLRFGCLLVAHTRQQGLQVFVRLGQVGQVGLGFGFFGLRHIGEAAAQCLRQLLVGVHGGARPIDGGTVGPWRRTCLAHQTEHDRGRQQQPAPGTSHDHGGAPFWQK